MLAEFDCIQVRRGADPEDEDHLVLGTIERSHPGIGLVPDAEVQEVAVYRPADAGQVIHVPPVHTDEVDRAVPGNAGAGAQRLLEECLELGRVHLAGRHGELAMPAAGIGMAVDPHVIGRIQEGGVDLGVVADDLLKERDVPAIAAADAMSAEFPDVAGLRPRFGGDLRDAIVVGIVGSHLE